MIALVTVTYNSATVLDDFLESVRALDTPVRLYVVDNASSDESLALLDRVDDLDMVVLPQPDNGGIAVGNNVGIRRACADGAEWIMLVNNDTTFGPDLVARLVAGADAAGADVIVPSIRYHEDPESVWFEAARFDHWRGSIPVALPPSGADAAVTIECANTCCALVRRSVFDRVGLMDEAYFVYWDDIDFFLRCWRAGVPMALDPRVTLLHKVSTLTGGGESDFSQRERIKNRAYYIRKHSRRLVRWVGLPLTAVNALKLVVVGDQRRRRLRLLTRAFLDGCAMPIGARR